MRIGNLQELPWYFRLTAFVAVAAMLYGGFWYFLTKGMRQETSDLNAEIAQLLTRNAQAQIASQRLNEFRAIYKARQEEYKSLRRCFPNNAS